MSLQKRVENAFEMMKVITEDFAVDQNVVKKNCRELPQERAEKVVHGSLKH